MTQRKAIEYIGKTEDRVICPYCGALYADLSNRYFSAWGKRGVEECSECGRKFEVHEIIIRRYAINRRS